MLIVATIMAFELIVATIMNPKHPSAPRHYFSADQKSMSGMCPCLAELAPEI